jgi:processive 1,2-diacylglycerol beta-glucosyltransferase
VGKEGVIIERVQLLTMGFGTGHNAAAEALEASFRLVPEVRAEVVDLLRLIPPSLHPLFQSGYHGMLNKFPTLYQYLYDWTHHSRVIRYVSSEVIEKMGWAIRKKLAQLPVPTRIVTTHPFALLFCPSKWANVPTVGVMTDYELHPIWFARVPGLLCVPKRLMDAAERERIAWKTGVNVVETGIPVNPEFYREIPSCRARLELGLSPERPVVLVMGGGAGLGPMDQLLEQLVGLTSIQFIVFTGKNEALLQRLKRRFSYPHIRVEGYRKDIPLWMSAADLLVTKPGGLTVSEAIAKRLPMFLFEAFPGQEEANQQYLISHGVAMITRPSTIRVQIEKFFSPQFRRERIRERFEKLVSPDAGEKIVQETLKQQVTILQTLS